MTPGAEPSPHKQVLRIDHAQFEQPLATDIALIMNSDPLPPADLESEDALGEHGEEHQPAGHDRLHQRQRRQRHRADVEQPGAE